jgi:hypothetical protein
MISPETIDVFETVIKDWNFRHKIIAENFIFNKTYEIICIYDNQQPKLFLKNHKDETLIDLEDYVRTKCQC